MKKIITFKEILDFVLRRPEFFTIYNSQTLDLFCKGCLTALIYYKRKDTDLYRFAQFNDFVLNKYNTVNEKKSWGEVILFFSRDDKESLANATSLIREFYLQDNKDVLDSNYYCNLEIIFKNCKNFIDVIHEIEKNINLIGIKDIYGFDSFYYGIYIFGDSSKSEDQMFVPPNDKKFIDLIRSDGNEFIAYLMDKYKIDEYKHYTFILKNYFGTPNHGLELLFENLNNFLNSVYSNEKQ